MKDSSYRTLCGLCHAGCGLIVEVKDGRVGSVKGDPDHPANRGYICPKALVVRELTESPERLKNPLQKTGNGFRPISWDDAYDFAAEKLTRVRDTFGPKTLVRNAGAPVSYEARDGFSYFMKALGSCNSTGAANLCMIPRMTAYSSLVGAKPEPDFDHSNMIILWASNPEASNRIGNYCTYEGFDQIVHRAKARGAKVVVIDPVYSETARKATEWIPINNGTDTALGLAMIHYIIENDLYDKEFVQNYTTGFEALEVHVRDFTPEWAAKITGIPAAKIAGLAREFATAKPGTIGDGNGFDMYCNVVDAVRTVVILLGITGNIDIPGGSVFLPFIPQARLNDLDPREQIWKKQFPIFPEIPFPAVKEALLRGGPEMPRVMIVHHSNPVLAQANSRRTREALSKLEFLLVDDIFLTSTAEIADLVLPALSTFEKYGYKAYSSFAKAFVALNRPVADPPGEARSVFEMEYQIARRMGLGDDYPFHDDRTWIDHVLKPSGITFADLDREQIVYFDEPVKYRKYATVGFPTPNGKMNIYSHLFKEKGQSPLPVQHEPAGVPLKATGRYDQAYPLLATNRRPGLFVHTKLHNMKTLTRRCPDPEIWMSGEDAVERGIVDGELVEVTTREGKAVYRARVVEKQKKGLVAMDYGWGNPADGKVDMNSLVNDDYWDPVAGATPHRLFTCEVCKRQGAVT